VWDLPQQGVNTRSWLAVTRAAAAAELLHSHFRKGGPGEPQTD